MHPLVNAGGIEMNMLTPPSTVKLLLKEWVPPIFRCGINLSQLPGQREKQVTDMTRRRNNGPNRRTRRALDSFFQYLLSRNLNKKLDTLTQRYHKQQPPRIEKFQELAYNVLSTASLSFELSWLFFDVLW